MNNPFDWESFTRKLREQLPDPSIQKHIPDKMDFSWIQDYVEDALEKSIGLKKTKKHRDRSSSQTSNNSAAPSRSLKEATDLYQLKPQVMDTITHVIVRIDVPEGLNAKRIRVQSSANRMRLRVLPQQLPQNILLPAKVLHRRAKAVYKHGVIEIQLPKNPEEESFRTIEIDYRE